MNSSEIKNFHNKRTLIMVEPGAPGKHIYSALKLPRLGATLLGTIMKNRGWNVSVYVEDIFPIDFKHLLKADVIGISTITSTATAAYNLADNLRNEGMTVVMGGPHVTFLPDEALDHCDFVVRGEGEIVFPELLEAIINKSDYTKIKGISYKNSEQKKTHNEPGEIIDNLDKNPFPDFSLIRGWTMAKSFNKQPIIPIQVSRGCPYGCKFCSVIQMFGRNIRYRSIDNVMEELEKYREKGVHIFFYDDNFAMDRKWAVELLEKEYQQGVPWKSWSAQIRADASKDLALMELMQLTNCVNTYIGFETVNPKALKNMHKGQTPESMRAAVKVFKKYNIDIHGMFIFGFDDDSEESIKATTQFALNSGINSVQFMILVPLPGTPVFDEMKQDKRLHEGMDWSNYDAHHVVFKPKTLTEDRLQWAQIQGHKRFYSPLRTVKKFIRGAFSTGSLYIYAYTINKTWQKQNRTYLIHLKEHLA